jgi:signal transduction histidine kinase
LGDYLEICTAAAAGGCEDAAAVAEGLRAVLAGDRAEFRHVYPSHGPDDSMAASSQVRICRLAGGDVREAVIVHDDVTDFGRTTEELRRTIARSEEAGRVKDDFLAMLSHELRTPLNSVLCWVQLLARGGLPPEEIRHGLAVIESIVRTQSRLINDLLDVSRIVAGKLVLDPVLIDPAELVVVTVQALTPAARERRIRLLTEISPDAGLVLADPARLQQVLNNLVSNALKFTPADGQVTVRLRRSGDVVRLGVADTGRGIAPEFLPHLFEKFRQADRSCIRDHGGLGLGLAIVRSLVELHGGRVRAESPGLGQGATFTVELPVARTEPRHYAGTREPLIRRPKYDDSRCPGLPVTPSESCGDGRPA